MGSRTSRKYSFIQNPESVGPNVSKPISIKEIRKRLPLCNEVTEVEELVYDTARERSLGYRLEKLIVTQLHK